MKCLIRRTLATAVGAALSVGFASQAFAVINTSPAAGGPELSLWVFDQGSNKSYTRDLGILLENFRTTATQIPLAGAHAFDPAATVNLGAAGSLGVNALGYTLSFGADPLLASFFTAGELATATYQVIVAKGSAQYAALTTSNAGMAAVQSTINSQLSEFRIIDNALESVNMQGTHVLPNLNGSMATADPNDIGNVGKSLRNSISLKAPYATDALVGTSLSFYQLTRNGVPASNLVNVTEFAGDWLLTADGALSYTVPVPEPETYALMVAGLGLVAAAIGRRRKTQ